MTTDFHIGVWVNPLQILELDEPWAAEGRPVTAEVLLKFLTTPDQELDLASLSARYKEVSAENPRIFVGPAERGILTRFIWPLRHAKAAYMVGNYLATVALAGFVAEMVAILMFTVLRADEATAEELAWFERLGQAERVDELKKLKVLQPDEVHAFGRVRATRRDYLHFWTQPDDKLATTAKRAYIDAAYLVSSALGLDFNEGKLVLRPQILSYLKKAGMPMEIVNRSEPEGKPSGGDHQ